MWCHATAHCGPCIQTDLSYFFLQPCHGKYLRMFLFFYFSSFIVFLVPVLLVIQSTHCVVSFSWYKCTHVLIAKKIFITFFFVCSFIRLASTRLDQINLDSTLNTKKKKKDLYKGFHTYFRFVHGGIKQKRFG